jgi:DNA-binding NtrC family response regulator
MYQEAAVLIYGRDPSLLETRRQVLLRGGFRVVAISQFIELTHLQAIEFDVFVLCHTLSSKDQQEAIAVSHAANPVLQTVVMTAYAPEFHAGSMSRFVSPFDGPEKLILQVRKAMERSDGGYAYQGDQGTRTVSVTSQGHEGHPSSGWMCTGHTAGPVTLATNAPKRPI